MQAKEPRHSVDDIIAKFVGEARQLAHVQSIVLQHARGDIPRVWTVIDAPPFDHSYLRAVILAQLSAIRDHDDPAIDFHFLNIQRLTSGLEQYLPTGQTLYQRKSAA